MSETWIPIPGYEGLYDVSDLGRVRSLDRLDARGHARREMVLKPRTSNKRHYVVLYTNGVRRRNSKVHRLVLEAFMGPCPDGLEGCHLNDDPTDNRLENLRWDTQSANMLDSVRNGTHHNANRTHCPQGHEYTSANTYVGRPNRRFCRECRRIGGLRRVERRRLLRDARHGTSTVATPVKP